MKARGRFIGDKIDLLVSYLVVHPFLRLYSKLPQKVKVGPAASLVWSACMLLSHPGMADAEQRVRRGCTEAANWLSLSNEPLSSANVDLHPSCFS